MLWNGNEFGKFKVMRISRQPSPVRNMIDEKQLDSVEHFNCIDSMMSRDENVQFNSSRGLLRQKRMSARRLPSLFMKSCFRQGAKTWKLLEKSNNLKIF
jgi:hypothetical protein